MNTNESWKRAQRTNQKYLLQKTQQQIEREVSLFDLSNIILIIILLFIENTKTSRNC